MSQQADHPDPTSGTLQDGLFVAQKIDSAYRAAIPLLGSAASEISKKGAIPGRGRVVVRVSH